MRRTVFACQPSFAGSELTAGARPVERRYCVSFGAWAASCLRIARLVREPLRGGGDQRRRWARKAARSFGSLIWPRTMPAIMSCSRSSGSAAPTLLPDS